MGMYFSEGRLLDWEGVGFGGKGGGDYLHLWVE